MPPRKRLAVVQPPACFACGDEFADLIDLPVDDDDTPRHMCRDVDACVDRQLGILREKAADSASR